MENLLNKLEGYLNENRTAIIGYLLWVIGCTFAFISLSALIAFLPRFYGYFWVIDGDEKLLYLIHRFMIVPAGIAFLGIFRTGSEIVRKNAHHRPDRIWNFYTLLFALEFVILVLAAKI
jgi:hypothetical protein